jgi:hypothetical protein
MADSRLPEVWRIIIKRAVKPENVIIKPAIATKNSAALDCIKTSDEYKTDLRATSPKECP